MKCLGFMISSVVLFFCIGQGARAAVWTNQNSWSLSTEKEFQNWVLNDWNKEIFSKKLDKNGNPNPYLGILNDCADTVYTMRLIFSYENKLPFEINDPTGGSLHISNQMGRWDTDLNEIQRVRKFINYIHGIVSTHSLPNDTYPVAISHEGIVPGALLMTGTKNHHSWTLKQMLSIGVPHLIYNSRVGAQTSAVLQERKTWPNPFWVFEGMGENKSRAGFRYWKSIEELEVPGERISRASLEQFKIPLGQWVETIQKRLAKEKETAEAGLIRVVEAVCDGLQQRVIDVKGALVARKKMGYKCMSAEDYDEYSTPSRDRRIMDDIIELRDLYSDAVAQREFLSVSMSRKMAKIFPDLNSNIKNESAQMDPLIVDNDSLCPIEYGEHKTIDIAETKRRFFIGKISSNPNLSISKRWGESSVSSEPGDSCPVYP